MRKGVEDKKPPQSVLCYGILCNETMQLCQLRRFLSRKKKKNLAQVSGFFFFEDMMREILGKQENDFFFFK